MGMLALHRGINESVIIGDCSIVQPIEVKVLEIRRRNGWYVVLGFDAPREIPVYRKELLQSTFKKRREPCF